VLDRRLTSASWSTRLVGCFAEHAVDERLLEHWRDIVHCKRLHQIHEAIHQMLRNVSDAALTSAQAPLQVGARHALAEPQSVARGESGSTLLSTPC
jgi:hypothetical protein